MAARGVPYIFTPSNVHYDFDGSPVQRSTVLTTISRTPSHVGYTMFTLEHTGKNENVHLFILPALPV